MSIALLDVPQTTLRFGVGDRVECSNGHGEWKEGIITDTFHADASVGLGMCVPYRVEINDGARVLAPFDNDTAIRKGREPASSPNTPSSMREGCAVELLGLQNQSTLNGRRARTLKWNEEKQRMGVALDDGTRIAVKLTNLNFDVDDDHVATAAAAPPDHGFEAASTFGDARPGSVFKRGPYGLGYYRDDRGAARGAATAPVAPDLTNHDISASDVTEQVRNFVADLSDAPPPPPSRGAGNDGAQQQQEGEAAAAAAAAGCIKTRTGAAALLNAGEPNAGEQELPDPSKAVPLLSRPQIDECFHAYKQLCAVQRQRAVGWAKGGGDVPFHLRGLHPEMPWNGFDLEVLLLLLGIKPSVLFCHKESAPFVQAMVEEVFTPWLTAVTLPEELSGALRLRQISHACTPYVSEDGTPCCFKGSWVLSAAVHPQQPCVEAAFFPPETLKFVPKRDPILLMLLARSLGYPSDSREEGNVDISYFRNDDAIVNLSPVPQDLELLDYVATAPREISRVVNHFNACRAACRGLVDIGFTMGGRAIRSQSLEALKGKSHAEIEAAFDDFADQINTLNMEEDEAGEHML